jgi:hypothetical protein
MAGERPSGPKPLDASHRPVWRRPAFLFAAALGVILLLVWLGRTSEPPPQVAVSADPPAPAASAPVQWPDLIDEDAAGASSNQSAATPVEAPGRTFIAKLNLQPRLVNGRLRGFVVQPEDSSILRGTPLRPGDVLLEVDGLVLDAARAAALANDVGDYQDVFIQYERGNVTREDILPLGAL